MSFKEYYQSLKQRALKLVKIKEYFTDSDEHGEKDTDVKNTVKPSEIASKFTEYVEWLKIVAPAEILDTAPHNIDDLLAYVKTLSAEVSSLDRTTRLVNRVRFETATPYVPEEELETSSSSDLSEKAVAEPEVQHVEEFDNTYIAEIQNEPTDYEPSYISTDAYTAKEFDAAEQLRQSVAEVQESQPQIQEEIDVEPSDAMKTFESMLDNGFVPNDSHVEQEFENVEQEPTYVEPVQMEPIQPEPTVEDTTIGFHHTTPQDDLGFDLDALDNETFEGELSPEDQAELASRDEFVEYQRNNDLSQERTVIDDVRNDTPSQPQNVRNFPTFVFDDPENDTPVTQYTPTE